MKNLIVFGGGGYCASVLIPQLINEGWNVTAFDKFWYGTGHLPKSEFLHLFHGDVRDLNAVKQALNGNDLLIPIAEFINGKKLIKALLFLLSFFCDLTRLSIL